MNNLGLWKRYVFARLLQSKILEKIRFFAHSNEKGRILHRNDGIGLVLFHFLLDFFSFLPQESLGCPGVSNSPVFRPRGSSFRGSGVSIGILRVIRIHATTFFPDFQTESADRNLECIYDSRHLGSI